MNELEEVILTRTLYKSLEVSGEGVPLKSHLQKCTAHTASAPGAWLWLLNVERLNTFDVGRN